MALTDRMPPYEMTPARKVTGEIESTPVGQFLLDAGSGNELSHVLLTINPDGGDQLLARERLLDGYVNSQVVQLWSEKYFVLDHYLRHLFIAGVGTEVNAAGGVIGLQGLADPATTGANVSSAMKYFGPYSASDKILGLNIIVARPVVSNRYALVKVEAISYA